MRTLVTGGAGFIGSHVAEMLVAEGHEVAVLDDLSTGKRENIPEGAEFLGGDIRRLGWTRRIMEAVKPEVVFHLAAQSALRPSVDDPWDDLDINVRGSLNVIEAARENGVGKIVYSSSGGASYGANAPRQTSEGADAQPNSPYGISKHTVEHYLSYYYRNFGLEYASLRYANVYGPRQDSEGEAGVVAIFARCVLEGRRPTIFGTGLQVRDYVYVTDVARANLLAAEGRGCGGAVNISTAQGATVSGILALIQNAAGTDIEPIYGDERVGDIPHCTLDNRWAKDSMGWQPTVSLEDGIALTVESIREGAMNKTVFLDRDGVLNKPVWSVARACWDSPLSVGELVVEDAVVGALRRLRDAGFLLVVVTNQPAWAKGKATRADLEAVRDKFQMHFIERGVKLDGYYCCYHHPTEAVVPELAVDCSCRKPKPGLLLEATADYAIDLGVSWMVGDRDSDVQAGQAVGCRTVLVEGVEHDKRGASEPGFACSGIVEAAEIIIREGTRCGMP